MGKLNIVSNVTNDFIQVDDNIYNELINVVKIKADTNLLITELNKQDIILLKTELEEYIEGMLNEYKIEVKGTLSNIAYNGRIYQLNFRDKIGFKICAFVSLYNICFKTLIRIGHLYGYDERLLEEFNSLEIVTVLRSDNSLSLEQMNLKIKHLISLSPNNNDKKSILVENGVNYLIEHGLVDFNNILKEYSLTSKGHMIR